MTEPKRLLDDPEMGALLRNDLEAARRAAGVDYDIERGLDRHMALVGAGVIGIVAGTATQTTSIAPASAGAASTSAASTGTLSAIKAAIVAKGIWVAAGIGVAGASAAVYATHESTPKPPAVVAPVSSAKHAERVTPAQAPQRETMELGDAVDPATLPLARSDAPKAMSPRPQRSVDADEVTTYAHARELASKDPAAALAILQDNEKRFTGGILTEEREALAVQCLSRLGRDAEARARGEAFLRAHPTSPLAERVRHDAHL